MGVGLSRRDILRQFGILSLSLGAGCTIEYEDPEQLDVRIKNCDEQSKQVHVNVKYEKTGARVHDKEHTVPTDYCSDIGPSYDIEDVWKRGGQYTIKAKVSGFDPVSKTVTLEDWEIEDDSETHTIHIYNHEIDIR